MSDDDLRLFLPILEHRQRIYDARMRDREAAARMAALANLPKGWVIDDAAWSNDLILQAIGREGDEIGVSGQTPEDAWRAMAESLAALGVGRPIRWQRAPG